MWRILMFVPPTDSFEATPLSHWAAPWPDAWKADAALKKAFGIELAKGVEPFKAALNVLKDNANNALWASHNWKNDPIVLEAKATKVVKSKEDLLDKEALAMKLLEYADEKDPSGRFCTAEHKDRLGYLKLYAEVMQFIGKNEINNTFNNNVDNRLELVLVKAPSKNEKPVTVIENTETEIVNALPANIKLVSKAS